MNCHLAGKVVFLNLDGEKLAEVDSDANGKRFTNPNDITADGEGGVIISDPGVFAEGSSYKGRIFHISKTKQVTLVHEGLKYPNGVVFDSITRTLFADEHLGRAVWQFSLNENWQTGNEQKILNSRELLTIANDGCVKGISKWPKFAGPDGIRLHPNGAKYIALYGLDGIIVIGTDGSKRCVSVPFQYPTSMAFSDSKIVITGTSDLFSRTSGGKVMIAKMTDFLAK